MDTSRYEPTKDSDQRAPFDLLRASVNLMVASAVISYATSQKLPLSTTYVTFMVAMGTSFADRAWGRESAVYRITGVLTVVGGWFFTAMMAFTVSALFALILWTLNIYGALGLLCLAGYMVWRNHHHHRELTGTEKEVQVFVVRKPKDARKATATTFGHVSHLIRAIRESLDKTLTALFKNREGPLREEKRRIKTIQTWANMIIANVFKSMRMIQKEDAATSHGYAQTIRRIQKLADGHRDLVMRAYEHVSNHHAGLLDVQVRELEEVKALLMDILQTVEDTFSGKETSGYQILLAKDRALRELAERLNKNQVERITDETSKTRLSILYYAIVGNARMLSKQVLKLMEIFHASFAKIAENVEFDLD